MILIDDFIAKDSNQSLLNFYIFIVFISCLKNEAESKLNFSNVILSDSKMILLYQV